MSSPWWEEMNQTAEQALLNWLRYGNEYDHDLADVALNYLAEKNRALAARDEEILVANRRAQEWALIAQSKDEEIKRLRDFELLYQARHQDAERWASHADSADREATAARAENSRLILRITERDKEIKRLRDALVQIRKQTQQASIYQLAADVVGVPAGNEQTHG